MLALKAKTVAHKFGAKKTQLDGIVFSSKAEAKRYAELKMLERAGHITDLVLQPKFELAPSVKYTGAARATPALRYVADFSYVDHLGNRIVEDVKGMATDAYKIKRHLMLAALGIEVQEIRRK